MSATAFQLNTAVPAADGSATLDLSASTSESMPIKVAFAQAFSIQAVIVGTANGNAFLMVSDDAETAAPVNWQKFPTTDAAISGAGIARWVVGDELATFEWVKVHYDKASNSGTMALRITSKGT